ncbi:hypothetical protein LZ32DRAFT_608405 [Colletotrichum eremochloae]|nr:hypothetical protein LZ32DRAFT_608405 [Colletotrichum eremochloae]
MAEKCTEYFPRIRTVWAETGDPKSAQRQLNTYQGHISGQLPNMDSADSTNLRLYGVVPYGVILS